MADRSGSETKGNLIPTPFLRAGFGSGTASIPNEQLPLNKTNSAGTRLKTAKEWEEEILFQMRPKSVEPLKTTEVKQSELITDVRELFGHDLNRKVSLRTAQDHKQGRPIRLKQFQANFQPGKVVCRHPACKNVKPEIETGEGKRDLYLCQRHRANLGDFIEKMCEKKKVKVGVSFSCKEGTFDGYTSMIGHLDQAYHDCMTSPLSSRLGWRTQPLVKETILNVRNYLVIVNAVLNPDEENLGIALPPVLQILREVLEHFQNRRFVNNLVYLLKEVVRTILFAFGVLYTWVSVALRDPGAQIGAGLGGVIGGVAGFFAAGPAGAGGGAAGGVALGGLIGNGISNLIRGQRQTQEFFNFWNPDPGPGSCPVSIPLYQFEGNGRGDLDLRLLTAGAA